jgi:ADP-heptose:LPS heptosyltransferase
VPGGQRRHAVRANQALARLAGSRLAGRAPLRSLIDPSFTILPEEQSWARSWLSEHLPMSLAPIVAIHPGAGAPLKQWPPEQWAEVARSLRASYRARIFLTGGPGEHELVEQIAARLTPRPPTVVGATSIGQLAALFQDCRVVLGCDSGPLHLAAAVGARTARLYGPTDSDEFGPWSTGVPHWWVEGSGDCPLGLQPCGYLASPPCGAAEHPPCLRGIEAGTVSAGAGDLLERVTPRC